MEEGAILEPLSVGVHACRKGGVGLGSDVLITGAGTIGIVTLFAAKAMGASSVTMTDVLPSRLETAKKCGADNILLVKPTESEEVLSEKIQGLIGAEPSITIDCTGMESSLRLAIQVL